LYKVIPEASSSSPLGRHIGHYKVASKFDYLSDLHATMMSIPYITGFSPERWKTVVDIMLEKNPGEPKTHRLCIIALQESDFNQSNRLLLARPLSHHLEDNNLSPSMQYGSRPGRHCHSAILNKQLTFELIRLTKSTASFIENDAIGCYNRMVNPLLILCLRKLGAHPHAVNSLVETWQHTTHYIKTKYGISSACYKNTADSLLFGPGQGSTLGPFLWLLCFILMVNSIHPDTPRLSLTSVDGNITLSHFGDSFVDDTALGCTAEPITSTEISLEIEEERRRLVLSNLTTLSQQWEHLLFSTGGGINLLKSFWFMMTWSWKDGVATLAKKHQAPGDLHLTAGYETIPAQVPRIEATRTYKTLGAFVSPSGNNTEAF
jgi:hypothetical protein